MAAEPYDLGLDIADGEDLELSLDRQRLTVYFTDWREEVRMLVFHSVIGIRWQEADDDQPGERPDSATLLVDSPWLSRLRARGEAGESTRHLKLNFNGLCCLEVLCDSVDVQ